MKSRSMSDLIILVGMVFLTVELNACAQSIQPNGGQTTVVDSDPIIAAITPDIERLYLSWHELDQAYKDFKFLEKGYLFDPDDRQLAYIQKAGLYIQDAAVRIHHRWEQLSVIHYIRPEMMRDYLTLNAKELTSAIKEIEYDEKFLTIYGAFITHEPVIEELDRVRESIKKNRGVLIQVLRRLLPIADTTTPPAVL